MKKVLASLFVAVVTLGVVAPAWALGPEEMKKILVQIDDRQRNSGDYKSLVYIEQKEKDKQDLVFEATVYRRDKDDQFALVFTKPKTEAGKGYLRVDKNLFIYDPTVGKWERRTERERIGGTDSRRQDFDESRLSEEYDPSFVGDEKLGAFQVHHLKLTVKSGLDVAYPVREVWVDQATGNVLKIQEFALSGKLLRTTYYPKWAKKFSKSKNAEVYYPNEIRIYDEVEKANSTVVVLRTVDLEPLESNIFTKAWVESQSR